MSCKHKRDSFLFKRRAWLKTPADYVQPPCTAKRKSLNHQHYVYNNQR